MSTSTWTESDTTRARELWNEYQRRNDLSSLAGKTVGIDPRSERLWIGESIADVVAQHDAEGLSGPLFFERVGSATYWRKAVGNQRWPRIARMTRIRREFIYTV